MYSHIVIKTEQCFFKIYTWCEQFIQQIEDKKRKTEIQITTKQERINIFL